LRPELTIAPPLSFEPAMTRGIAQRAVLRGLSASGIDTAHADARILLCAALGIEYAELVRDPARPIGQGADVLKRFMARRLKREPVSRIIGARNFWRARFQISPAVFDPRPATEALVEAALDHAARYPRTDWRILDLGTGSGAILCSLLQCLPGSSGIGVDLSFQACTVANTNVENLRLGHRALIVCGDWTHALSGRFDMIVANPPYVAQGEFADLPQEVVDHDPRLALDGGKDGLAAYREIIPGARRLLAPGGIIALEIGVCQRLAVESLLKHAFGLPAEAKLDLDGHWRIVMIRLPL
jgi:release factor glutamine methyltransferase